MSNKRTHTANVEKVPERPQQVYAGSGNGKFHAIEMVWPLAWRRLEACPNINSSQLFEDLCVQLPGRFNPRQLKTLTKRVKVWRQDARARGVVIEHLKYRNLRNKPRGLRPDPRWLARSPTCGRRGRYTLTLSVRLTRGASRMRTSFCAPRLASSSSSTRFTALLRSLRPCAELSMTAAQQEIARGISFSWVRRLSI